ncbi:hypothetical protein THAOC_05394, partial [Thalassiosira oceanica]
GKSCRSPSSVSNVILIDGRRQTGSDLDKHKQLGLRLDSHRATCGAALAVVQ